MHPETILTVPVGGLALHCTAAGAGRPVVLLHGNGEDHHLFDTQIEQLADAGYRVYAPDSRGHGLNPPLPEYHYADMAEDVFGLIGALGLERPALYGHSDGGIIGLMLEIAHPGTLSALAVSGANLSPAGLRPEFLAECAALHAQHPDPLLKLMLTEPDIDPEALRHIEIPVLVTAGEHDLILPGETRRIASAIPRAVLKILSGHDHGSYIAGSRIMGDLLLSFLEGCQSPA